MAANSEILAHLDTLTRLVSILVTKDMAQKDQIAVLSKAGMQPREISDLIGTTPHTVSVTLSDLRKQGKSKRGGKKS